MSHPGQRFSRDFARQSFRRGKPLFTVERAEAMGWCFGVRDAVTAAREHEHPDRVAIHGELVHNDDVLGELAERGFESRAEDDRERPHTRPEVLVTAHGISDVERVRLLESGAELLDTTCPLVRKAHRAARMLAEDGRHVIVIGKPGHVEVEGLVGDLPDHQVASRPEDVVASGKKRVGVVFQTTTEDAIVPSMMSAIRASHPAADIVVKDTICEPTRQRQRALEELIARCEVLIAVGGQHSNNTKALVRVAAESGLVAHRVSGPADLDPSWFEGVSRVGLTAGTSTPDEAITAVEQALHALAHQTVPGPMEV